MIRVKATREGLPGQKTSSGWRINDHVPFVALPSAAALRQWVRVRNPATGAHVEALVLDVGPWNEQDDLYVFQDATLPGAADGASNVRPGAESGLDQFGRHTNGAGIDLGERVWAAIGMGDNTDVEWEFL